ncbi:MAG: histidine kinase [Halanaerobiales bacterium]
MKEETIRCIIIESLKSGIIGIGISLMFVFAFLGRTEENIFIVLLVYIIFGYIVGVLIPLVIRLVIYFGKRLSLTLFNNIFVQSLITYVIGCLVFYFCSKMFFIVMGNSQEQFNQNITFYVSLGTGVGAVMIFLFFNYIDAQKRQIQLEKENRQLAVIEERNRIARELHDSVSQNLFGISLNLKTLPAVIKSDEEKAVEMTETLQDMVQEIQTEMRLMIYELRPISLQEKDFFEAVENLVYLFKKRYDLKINCRCRGNENNIDNKKQLVLYRILQEALNNVVKHSGADRANVFIKTSAEITKLTVCDNGEGFNANNIDTEGHFGIKGMEERVKNIGGMINIESNKEQGTTVKVSI